MKSFPLLAWICLLACNRPPTPPLLSALAPSRVSSFKTTALSLSGEFDYAITGDLDHPSESVFALGLEVRLTGPQVVVLTDAVRVSASEVAATVPPRLLLGHYTVEVTTARGTARLVDALEVADCFDDCATGCFSWPDRDHDGWGAADAGAAVCPDDAGSWISRAGDCLDGDPLTNPDGVEICNGIDDNCNGAIDEGVCPADAGWKLRADTGNPSYDWQTASDFGRGRLWIAGKNHVEVRADAGAFVEVGSGCTSRPLASWANPSTGFVYLGGQGQLSTQALGAGSCGATQSFNGDVVGLQGFLRADGGLEVYGALDDGDLLELQSNGQFSVRIVPANFSVNDVQGFSTSALFAVGRSSNGRPAVWRMPTDGGGYLDEGVEGLALPNQTLNAVWAVDETLAYAVGSLGALVERGGAGWVARPGASTELTAVRAFGRGRVYAASSDGRVLRFDGTQWQQLYRSSPGTALRDIAGTAEDDLWVVGDNGVVLHWP